MPHNLRLIELVCPEFGQVCFMGDNLHEGHDRLIRANCDRDALEVLVFLDSRGIGADFSGSLVERILTQLNGSRGYLAICRPLELTTWATLFNFLAINALNPRQIITNVGFVDFTPKKQAVVDAAVQQVEARMGVGLARSQFVEEYATADGETLALYSMSYAAGYRRRIEIMIAGGSALVLNTPPVSPDIRVSRKRPRSFFSGVEMGNAFNRSISGATVIDLPEFDELHTYDAVHYTNRGNELIFGRLVEHL
jgi:hypothetical protein